jgi:ribosome-binding factor A
MSVRRSGGARRGASTGPNQRQLRVGEELRHALVTILRESPPRDPDLQDANVTVTEVRISPDLKNATAFVMPLAGQNETTTVAALNRASPYFRAQVARNVQLRYAPAVHFELDTSFAYAERIEGLLNAPDVKRDINHDPQPDSGN